MSSISSRSRASDHPRSRGEYPPEKVDGREVQGSSPLSRGIRFSRPRVLLSARIIPALAGNTVWVVARTGASKDHPRSRGEYRLTAAVYTSCSGSSPLSRGIRYNISIYVDRHRIIPALAGNTCAQPRPAVRGMDHPRSRGEYVVAAGPVAAAARIIPALAGNTPRTSPAIAPAADHPRSRGEYRSLWPEDLVLRGSSPLSRGIRVNCLPDRGPLRIIPALAGNT